MKHIRKLVSSLPEVEKLIEYVKTTGYCSFDFETYGHYYDDDSFITLCGISFQPGSAWVIPMKHYDSTLSEHYEFILRRLQKEVWENPKIIKIAFNIQFELCWLRKYGIIPRGRMMDAMLAKYLLHEEKPNDLGYVSALIFPEFAGFKDNTESLARKFGWDKIPIQDLFERNSLDCDLTLRLMLYFEQKLIENKMYKIFRNLLMMYARNLSEVSFFGIDIDTKYLNELSDTYIHSLKELEQSMLNTPKLKSFQMSRHRKIRKQLITSAREALDEAKDSGKTAKVIANKEARLNEYIAGIYKTKKDQELFSEFNPKSGKQLIEFLFDSKFGLRLEPTHFTMDKKTKKQNTTPSVNEEALKELAPRDKTGFIDSLLKYNKLEHLYSTYIKGMQERVSKKNKVHTSFLIHGTVTGRLSCVAGDTLILTNQGNIPIESICPKEVGELDISELGLKTITHKGRYRNISRSINKGIEDMFEVTLESGETIKATRSHKLLTNQGWYSLGEILDSNNTELEVLIWKP